MWSASIFCKLSLVLSLLQITISVLDSNDSPPVFDGSPYRVSLSENAIAGHVVVTVSASDPDTEGSLTYALEEPDGRFRLDPLSGALRLSQPLDREAQDTHKVRIRADDGVQFTETTLVIEWIPSHCGVPGNEKADILDKNGCDRFERQLSRVRPARVLVRHPRGHAEGRPGGAGIRERRRHRRQQGDQLLCAERLGQQHLLAQPADRHLHPHLAPRLRADAALHLRGAGAGLRHAQPLQHGDGVLQRGGPERQRAPLRPHELQRRGVREHHRGHQHPQGQCHGHGFGQQVRHRYRRYHFHRQDLDRETQSFYSLTVSATDRALDTDKRLSSTVQVSVILKDVNDMAPEFVVPNEISVMENVPSNTVVMAIKAIDRDEGRNSYIEYSLASQSSGKFSLGPIDGLLRVVGPLDREQISNTR
ncbi:cadherin-related tumor suppressor [Caerostris extrusa]|uniref:Cadherin-related tumor suppressor n=1 Tax=Caerostris extrusa TaxID=172846 RepID=A0AAV4TRS5_CAEEX|nr:cadherin-related tumor suppressor [Caerostris extrusa]